MGERSPGPLSSEPLSSEPLSSEPPSSGPPPSGPPPPGAPAPELPFGQARPERSGSRVTTSSRAGRLASLGVGTQVRPFGRYLPRDRIRKRSEFRTIQDAGHRVVSAGFVFLLGRYAGKAGVPAGDRRQRLGITASRKVGNAVQRNRAKRLLREAFRCIRSELPSGLDLLVIVRQGIGNRTLADVVSEWQSCRARIERRFAALPAGPGSIPSGQASQPVNMPDPIALSAKNPC